MAHTHACPRRRAQAGTMSENNTLIWPALYGYTAWLWGSVLGYPIAIAAAGTVLGFVVGVLMMRVNPYGPELMQFWLIVIVPWFVSDETWRWVLLAMCIVPLQRLIAGLVLKKTWSP